MVLTSYGTVRSLDREPSIVRDIGEYRELAREALGRAPDGDWGRDFALQSDDAARAIATGFPPEFVPHIEALPLADRAGRDTVTRALARLATELPGCLRVHLRPGGDLTVSLGKPRLGIEARPVEITAVAVNDSTNRTLTLDLDGATRAIPAGAADTIPFSTSADLPQLAANGLTWSLARLIRRTPAATLHVTSSRARRWTIQTPDGASWFPDSVERRWGNRSDGYFYASNETLVVPAGPLTATAWAGIEHHAATVTVDLPAGEAAHVALEPRRSVSPPAGWISADMHVHMNYSGDLVVTPTDAQLMQEAEQVDVVAFLAANLNQDRVYDRGAHIATCGREVATPNGPGRSIFGAEFRNDLFGHLHLVGLKEPLACFASGHEAGGWPDDDPTTLDIAAWLRNKGATIGLCHPRWARIAEDGGCTQVFDAAPRSVEARAAIHAAVLGLADCIDILSPGDTAAAMQLYDMIVSCGLRLGVSAGTDTFLSFSHGLNAAPMGWGRVYLNTGGRRDIEAVTAAIRAQRSYVTTGPSLNVSVSTPDGAHYGPGDVLNQNAGTQIRYTVRCSDGRRRRGSTHLQLRSNRGIEAESSVTDDGATLTGHLALDRPLWLSARLEGARPNEMFAAASAIYVLADGKRVAEPAAARWCLTWLDEFDQLIANHARFTPHSADRYRAQDALVRRYLSAIADGRDAPQPPVWKPSNANSSIAPRSDKEKL